MTYYDVGVFVQETGRVTYWRVELTDKEVKRLEDKLLDRQEERRIGWFQIKEAMVQPDDNRTFWASIEELNDAKPGKVLPEDPLPIDLPPKGKQPRGRIARP